MGTLESNESLIDCIYRELAEEINLKESDISHITPMFFEFSWGKNDGTTIREYVFGVELAGETEIILGDEHEEYKWCSFEEAIGLLQKENNIKAYLEFRKRFMR